MLTPICSPRKRTATYIKSSVGSALCWETSRRWCHVFISSVSLLVLQFTTWSPSVWRPTTSSGKPDLSPASMLMTENQLVLVSLESGRMWRRGSDQMPCFLFLSAPQCMCACVRSEEVLPSIHRDAGYPCELVGTWNTWYGEQDQAGRTTSQNNSWNIKDVFNMWPWSTKPVIRVNFVKLRCMHHLKAE